MTEYTPFEYAVICRNEVRGQRANESHTCLSFDYFSATNFQGTRSHLVQECVQLQGKRVDARGIAKRENNTHRSCCRAANGQNRRAKKEDLAGDSSNR